MTILMHITLSICLLGKLT